MSKVLIGAGGWSYFRVPGMDSLRAYSMAFDFVEVNSTFYTWPSLSLVHSWRSRVPEDFEFTLRCHKSITHSHMLATNDYVVKALNKTAEIYKILKASLLVIETPQTLSLQTLPIERLESFFKLCLSLDMKLAWEARGLISLPQPYKDLMKEFDVAHCVDLSLKEPEVETSTIYSRIFGKGEHNIYQFTDEELLEINEKAERHGKTMICFHGVRMYTDAARLKAYRKTGIFPKATKSVGIESVREVILEENVRFPISRDELNRCCGWRVFDLTEDKRIRLSTILSKLPATKYQSLSHLLNDLSKVIKDIT
ncbi:MAG: hypothetical protein DRJ33_01245 [Candidatus Methanomethylicota archaeon]|uniref:DUF72 domain-containing protein n=1 Tax=Thermoproteota archaeon TaxID=2056631 RepID=A0A497F1Y7_9CREN|nr:MAG: hypothetical protein DRJ33_01245 [Candidatus Verstraetearchaeota archaeon]